MNDCRKCTNNGICKQLGFMSPKGCFSFQENGLVRLPKIYIKDMATREIFLFGTDIHDSLYIDKQGNLQYINLHNGLSTGIKEECAKQIQLAQKEIDKGAKQNELH